MDKLEQCERSTTDVRFQEGTILGLGGLRVNYDANNTVSFRFGTKYRPVENWTLMGGYVYDPSFVDDDRVDILTYSSDRHIVALMVPRGCSTVSRRVRMAYGFSSSRRWTASKTCSCSHRLTRRSVAGVHRSLRAQRPQTLVQ